MLLYNFSLRFSDLASSVLVPALVRLLFYCSCSKNASTNERLRCWLECAFFHLYAGAVSMGFYTQLTASHVLLINSTWPWLREQSRTNRDVQIRPLHGLIYGGPTHALLGRCCRRRRVTVSTKANVSKFCWYTDTIKSMKTSIRQIQCKLQYDNIIKIN